MDLHEEYLNRKKIKAHVVKYADKANLLLRAKKPDLEWAWLHLNVNVTGDNNHPVKYSFVISGNPTLYTDANFSHFSNHSKVLKEQTCEWDQYEKFLTDWIAEYADKYEAITSNDAIFVAWEMFISNYDSWMAHFLPIKVQELVYKTLSEKERKSRLEAIQEVESFIRYKYERVFLSWKNIKGAIEQKNYADWLANIVNEN